MTDNVEPIRKKTMWQNVEMMEIILGGMEELVEMLGPDVPPEHKEDLEENKAVLERLKERAEQLEGPRP